MRAAAAGAALAAAAAAGFGGTTVAGPATVLGGPITTNFDLPLHAILLPDGSVRGYTGNAVTYLAVNGTSVADVVAGQVPVGLGPSPNITDLDHCGAWLNAAWVDTLNRTCDGSAASPPIVHGFYHEEWQCDYARGFFTNKSIAYAVSCDGGLTFTKPGHPGNAIIEAANFSSSHQCGDGDHGAVQFGADFLYLYFLEWDGWHDDPQIGVARAPLASGGVPGSWTKYCGGAFACPGLGGNSDMVANMTGTAVMPWSHGYPNASAGGLAAFGLFGTGYPTLSFSDDGLHWQPAGLPVTIVEPSASWNRSVTPSLELYGYWSMTGARGTADTGDPPLYAWATYWPPGSVERYLVRRQVDAFDHVTVECAAAAEATPADDSHGAAWCAPPREGGSYASPPALLTLSQYVYTPPAGAAGSSSTSEGGGVAAWATTGVVLPSANYTLATPAMAYVLPLDASAWYGGNGTLVALHDCYTAVNAPPGSGLPPVDHWIALDGECNATTAAGGNSTSPRRIGWTWATPFDSPVAQPAATSTGTTTGGSGSSVGGSWPTAITFLGQLTRCRDDATGYHYVTFNDATCSTAPGGGGSGGTPEASLGFAYAPLQVVAPPPQQQQTPPPHR